MSCNHYYNYYYCIEKFCFIYIKNNSLFNFFDFLLNEIVVILALIIFFLLKLYDLVIPLIYFFSKFILKFFLSNFLFIILLSSILSFELILYSIIEKDDKHYFSLKLILLEDKLFIY